MEEARYSINIRFNCRGYDSQLTIRGDGKDEIQADFEAAMDFLQSRGAAPERRWENGKSDGNRNGNGHPVTQTVAQAVPSKSPDVAGSARPGPVAAPHAATEALTQATRAAAAPVVAHPLPDRAQADACPKCGVIGQIEWIDFTDKETHLPKRARKCQACKKWLK
jgi:hypothetical protein